MDDETNILDQLVSRVADETLRSRLAREVELLRGSRRFGLVFDRHLPESVKLTDHPIRKGVRVSLRDESTVETWRVVSFADTTRTVAVLDGDGGERSVSDLVVVREFGEPIYPGLQSIERIQNGPADAPWHTVVNGENFHALQALRWTHRGKVDLIYIDPPYNTGNDGWIYNDRYIDNNDRAKSSKWLSFLERRLEIASSLLEPTGVIIVAIGDEEHHRLRMLLDQMFGPENFLSDVVWQGGRKNDSRYVSNGADYMLIYAKDELALAEREIRWREEKPGVHDVLVAAKVVWDEAEHDEQAAEAAMRKWFRAQPKDSPIKALGRYVYFLPDGTLCRDSDLMSPNPRPNLQYDILHPATGKPAVRHPNGWRWTRETMDRMLAEGHIIFRSDPSVPPRLKKPLEDAQGQVARSVFDRERTHAGRHLQNVFGDTRFPYPKDHEVLMRWIRLAAPKDAIVVDFFGGSGTTTEAVMRLNAEDGGTRQSILVTNNELGAREAKRLRNEGFHPGDPEWEPKGVFEYVCRPRISTVVTGTRPDGSKYSDGLAANVEMFRLTYLDPGRLRSGREYGPVAPLMWMEGGARGERVDEVPDDGWALTESYGVLFSIDALTPFANAVAKAAAGEAP
ncbi:site-specific DNA-methyltransferase [Nonomuraea cavernae]|uniref:site-specific DNA-methyltransferase n=1 Tax=Nonomuraea cavernae TaxID=2045107 RepID=UPI0033E0D093